MAVTVDSTPTLSVVVMAYDEESGLGQVAEELLVTVGELGLRAEVIIVDDGSRDRTGDIADQLAQQNESVRVVHHRPNQGLGGVYRTGFAEARGEWLTFIPADGELPARSITLLWARSLGADFVLGYLPERPAPLSAKLLSWAERALLRAAFGYFPRFQGVLLFRREWLDKVELQSTGRGWTILMELILKASRAGAVMKSQPTPMGPRLGGASKARTWANVSSNLRQLVELRLRMR